MQRVAQAVSIIPRTIKGFILVIALLVSLLLFAGVYYAISTVYDYTVREDAHNISKLIAKHTFNGMYQVMRRGWTRKEVDDFIASTREAYENTPYSLNIYRGPRVEQLFGPIEQPEMDAVVNRVFRMAVPSYTEQESGLRYVYPMTARKECLKCHTNAKVMDVLGVIELKQDLAPLVKKARSNFLFALMFIAPIPLIGAFAAAYLITRRMDRAVQQLRKNVQSITRVSDLKNIDMASQETGFEDFNEILHGIQELSDKLRNFAVDKDLLEFEIRLLERFIITSDVVRDWHEYIKTLLLEINALIPSYNMFSLFKSDDSNFELEVFWRAPPSEESKILLELNASKALLTDPNLGDGKQLNINHHVAEAGAPELHLNQEEIEVQTKSLVVDAPMIGGIVGIGVQAEQIKDPTRLLVVESILSTLLNVVGSVKAISKYTRELEYYATRDPLTNLYNQRVFWDLMEYEIGRAERHAHRFALLVIDLDNFKHINDTYGHAVGDRYLQAMAEGIQQELRKGDVFARYGGDEFVILLPEIEQGMPYATAERILKATEAVEIESDDGVKIRATVSIGIAVWPDHAGTTKELFLFADNMMYKAKAEGKNRLVFPGEDDLLEAFREVSEKSAMVTRAVEERWVEAYFQPIIATRNDELQAYEVLSRIQIPDGDLLGAGEFIEIAEQLGIIHKLDYVVMEKAFQQARQSNYAGLLFINISPKALVLNEFFQTVKQLIGAAGIEPGQVVFELTERETVKNMRLLERFVQRLHMEGFKFAIDDFGSGFSSFHYIKRFPIDFIKIEGEFIMNMLVDERDRAFVDSIALLARELNIETIAEFIENDEVYRQVKEVGIALAQGYHIGRPVPQIGMEQI